MTALSISGTPTRTPVAAPSAPSGPSASATGTRERLGRARGGDLPPPRGPASAFVISRLQDHEVSTIATQVLISDDPLTGEDSHLALYLCYELHYRSFAGVDDAAEWDPELLALRRRLEQRFLTALLAETPAVPPPDASTVAAALTRLIRSATGRSLSGFMAEHGELGHLREFAVHRSAYQLKEADPHTWGIPRLSGRAKSALITIQADEYGQGRPGRSHAELFVTTMRALGLDATYGRYLAALPGVTLATTNLVTLFGLHRRWRGALVGHLAVFEMTSVTPMARYAAALRRLGVGEAAAEFYDVHVSADALHERIAATDLAAGLLEEEPQLGTDVVFGAAALMSCERRLADHLLACWQAGRSSLLCG